MNALIVEPSRSYCQLLQSVFESHDFQAIMVLGVEEALDELASNNFQVICLSMNLTDGNSFDLCRQIRNNDRSANTPIMMLTASVDSKKSERAYSVGVTELFSKQDFTSFEAYLSSFNQRLVNKTIHQGSILYLEDSPTLAQITISVLTDEGYQVDHFVHAQEAIEALFNRYHDLLITDVVLEGPLNGLAVVRAVREHASQGKNQLPILAVSGYQDDKTKLALFNAGVNDYISKPVMNEELLARVKLLITNHQLLINLQNKQQQLEQQAMTDQLTRLYNRYYLMDVIPKKLSLSKRHGHPLSLLVIDIDKFKSINDENGHDVGDKVLCAIAKMLVNESRMEDVVTRFGGEEFVVLLDHCNIGDAIFKAEHLREHLEKLNPCGLLVTASFGISAFQFDDNDFSSVFLRADEAVFKAKSNGRNCVIAL